MKMKVMAIAVFGALAASAHAQTAQPQTMEDLQKALAQAQKAAADAQAAARQAQDALEKIQKAMPTEPPHKQIMQDVVVGDVPLATAPALATDQQGAPLEGSVNPVALYTSRSTSLRMYGLVEATISRATDQATGNPSSPNSTTTGFQVAWFSGNRLGFDMQHALDFGKNIGMPDLKVISKLETEFELPTGNSDTPGVLFNRDAWLGLYSDSLGKLTLGRQNTLTRDFTSNWGDPYGTADVTLKEGGYTNVNNFKQFIFYSGAPSGTRLDSGIEWKKKLDDHWLLGVGYGFSSQGAGGTGNGGSGTPLDGGGAIPGDQSNQTSNEISIAYNRLDLGGAILNLSASYNRGKAFDLIDQAWLVGGNLSVGPFRWNAGAIRYTAQQGLNNSLGTRTDTPWTTSVSYLAGQTDFALGYQEMKGKHAAFNSAGFTALPFFGVLGGSSYNDTSASTRVADGGKNTIYGSIMFHADKQTDFYIAADYAKTTGGWVTVDGQGNGKFGAGQASNSETELATGVRFKF